MDGDRTAPASLRRVRFGQFEYDLHAAELRRNGLRIRVQQKPLQLLGVLVARRGELVTREELRQQLWPADTFVDFDHGLNKTVNKLRTALGDTADNPRFIETLARRGYRFIGQIDEVVGAPSPIVGADPAALPAAQPVPLGESAGLPLAEVSTPRARSGRRGAAWWMALAVGVAVAALASWGLPAVRRSVMGGAPPNGRQMLAVLPFADLGNPADEDYFADGLTEEMITALSQLNPTRLGVIARTSSMHYKRSSKRVPEIARELGVQFVLEGAVRRTEDRLRITARLIGIEGETPLWSDTFDRQAADVLDVQTEVAQRIAAAMALELLPRTASAPDHRPVREAYDAYLEGRYYWNRRTPADLTKAVALLEAAVARDPAFVPSAAALADALNVLPWYGLRPPDAVYPRAKEVARQALARDDRSAAAHTALAYAHHYYDWSWAEAEREYGRALALNPSYAQAHQWRAAHEAELGRFEAAVASMREAERLDPRAPIIKAGHGWILYLGRRYDESVVQLGRVIETDPDFVPARLWLAQVLEVAGRADEALPHLRHVRTSAGTDPTGLGELARGLAAVGRIAEARAALDELLVLRGIRYVEADLIARVYLGLGDRAEALRWLERGLTERAAKMVLIGVDPQYDALRDDERFRAMVRRLDLPNGPPPWDRRN